MRQSIQLMALLFLFSCFVNPALSQSEVPIQFLQVDYMKVAPDKAADYEALEKEVWKPIHRARVEAGTISGWYFYSVMYPAGSSTEYNYLTVNIYDDFSKTDETYSDDILMKGHPNATAEQLAEMLQKTMGLREHVRSELWQLEDHVPVEIAAPFHKANFMKVVPGMDDEYLELERDIWKPIHKTYKQFGYSAGWGSYSLLFPGGTEQPYNYGTIDFYKDYLELVISVPDSIVRLAHPNAEELNWDNILSKTFEIRDHARQEVRALIDFVNASTAE